jgi:3-oxoacyl-[acyl-carrier-protein] synthase-3
MQQDTQPGIFSTHIHSDGAYQDLLGVPWGVGQGYDKMETCSPYVAMKGNDVFKVAVKTLSALITSTLHANGMTPDDPFWLVPHQANIRIIEASAKRIGLDPEKVIITVDKHANTSAASIPLALRTGIEDGRIKPGDKVLMEAFGGGFTWGSALVGI